MRRTRAAARAEPNQGNPSQEEEDGDGRLACTLFDRVQADVKMIGDVAAKTKNLKGTYVRILKDATSSIRDAVQDLKSRSASDETRRLQADNDRLRKVVESLRGELAEIRKMLQSTSSPEKERRAGDVYSPAHLHAGGERQDGSGEVSSPPSNKKAEGGARHGGLAPPA